MVLTLVAYDRSYMIRSLGREKISTGRRQPERGQLDKGMGIRHADTVYRSANTLNIHLAMLPVLRPGSCVYAQYFGQFSVECLRHLPK